MKANWDAALIFKKRRMGIGDVIKDVQGEVMVSLCNSKGMFNSPAIIELHVL